MKSNPNSIKTKIWSTYIPSRSPKFKIHNCMGHAVNALKYRAVYTDNYKKKSISEENKLYKFIDSEWVELDFEREYAHRQEGLIFK